MDELERAVDTVVRGCLGAAPGDDVVVVADTTTRRTGNMLREAAAEVGVDAVVLVMDPRETDGQEPPPAVAAALVAGDVFIAPTARSSSHTGARRAATDTGARGATLPGILAFGASAGFGGTVTVPIHLDCVVLSPTLDVGGIRVLEAGELILDA